MSSRIVCRLALAAALCAGVALPMRVSASVALSPMVAGAFQAGTGLDARFVQIDSRWHGSTVLWDDAEKVYGSGLPIASYAWGTGLWGAADWQTVQDTADGVPAANAPALLNTWAGRVDQVNFGNALYNGLYSGTWGPAELLPFFDAAGAAGAQENWTAHFTGFLRVSRPGTYDLSVLNDDGFFLRLVGGSQTLEIGRDFLNPRERNGFRDSLWLDTGLYGLELGMWNRLEAGVVDLRWSMDGGENWALVPTAHLIPSLDLARAVPLPATLLLALAALAAIPVVRRARRAAGRGACPS